jgi:hypothetical protein
MDESAPIPSLEHGLTSTGAKLMGPSVFHGGGWAIALIGWDASRRSSSVRERQVKRRLEWTAVFALCIFCSNAAMAAGLEIPEVGVQLANVPPEVGTPFVDERPDGYSAVLMFGVASLVLVREDPLLPAERAVSDADFQKTLRARHRSIGDRIETAALANIGGQPAWFMSGIRATGPVNVWYIDAFVIVDRQVVRITAEALGKSKRPADFERAVALLTSVTFGAVRRPEPPVAVAGAKSVMPPRFVSAGGDLYPAPAVRLEREGSVGITFRIDGKGRVHDVKQIFSDYLELGMNIAEFLNNCRFRVPEDWSASGNAKRQFTAEIQFVLAEHASKCPKSRPSRVPEVEVMQVCHAPRP